VTGYVPAGVDADVETVNVALPPEVTVAGLNDAVAPVGRPIADRLTDSAPPPVTAVETVVVADDPAVAEPDVGNVATEKSLGLVAVPVTTSILGMFHPDTLTTGVAPCRSAELYVAVRVSDSPGHSVTSLLLQMDDCNSLSPDNSVPDAVPRRTSAR